MAKGSQFWGNASGKLGEQVLYRAGGEQRARTYVAKIKNPRTLAQVENRLSMLNFATTYRMFKPILSVSFPNRPQSMSGFNAFVKANKSINSPVIDRAIAQKGLCVPYRMIVSQGTLNVIGSPVVGFDGDDNAVCCFDLTANQGAAAIRAKMTELPAFANLATKEHLEEFLGMVGLPTNVKFTILKGEYEDEGFAVSNMTFDSSSDLTKLSAFGMTFKIETGAIGKNNQALMLTIAPIQDEETIFTAIISYSDGSGKLQITQSSFVHAGDTNEFADQFVKGGDVYNQILNDFGYTEASQLATK